MAFPRSREPPGAGGAAQERRHAARDAMMTNAERQPSAYLASSRRLMLYEGQVVLKSPNGNRRLPPTGISGMSVFAFIAPVVPDRGSAHLPCA
jgi:hypothetical protein